MTTIDLPLLYSGKVREIYDAGDKRLLLVTSDRLSAFDVVMAEPIPDKGRVLTAMSAFWFDHFGQAGVKHHMITTDLHQMPPGVPRIPELEGRVMLCRKAEMLPIECIVRGYITGTAWKSYKKDGTVNGEKLPDGLLESQKLPTIRFTPSTKYEEKDRNVDDEEAIQIIQEHMPGMSAEALYVTADHISTQLYTVGAEWAAERGIIIADTKFELGVVEGELIVCDEVLTPDSSRFWSADQWKPGSTPPSFDKQPVRDELDALDWDKTPPPPPLSEGTVEATSRRYIEAYERVTGLKFTSAA